MKKKQRFLSSIHFTFIALLLITYLFFPSFYISISQRLFAVIYRHNAQSLQEFNNARLHSGVYVKNDILPLNIIARPPQTPYDFLIATTASGHGQEKEIAHYVYNSSLIPIGYIEKKYKSLYVVALFSSPKSNEKFSVNGYVSRGSGEGGGSFSIQIPADISVKIGMPITHQVTGTVVSVVAAIKYLPEKNIQQVIGILHSNPLQIATLYVKHETGEEPVTTTTVEEVIELIKNTTSD